MGNFKKYNVYSCDFPDGCMGGCALNASCSGDRLQSSPTCGAAMPVVRGNDRAVSSRSRARRASAGPNDLTGAQAVFRRRSG